MRRSSRRRAAVALLAMALVVAEPAGLGSPARARSLAPGRLIDASFRSAALGGARERLRVWVPAACTRARPCPVLYLLHGVGGGWKDWTAHGEVHEAALDPAPLRLVVVMPDGAPAGFWTDWYNEGRYGPPRYETMFLRELMPFVERRFPVLPGRRHTAIDGASLGGFGAFKLALRHPDRFASVGAMSGALNVLLAPNGRSVASPVSVPWTGDTLPRTPALAAPDIPQFPYGNPVRVFGDPVTNEWYYRANNPLDLAPNAGALAMRFVVFDGEPPPDSLAAPGPSLVGDEAQEAVVLPMNLEMHERLLELGYEHEFEVLRGNHSWASRRPHVRRQLEFHARALAAAPSPPRSFVHRTAHRRFSVFGYSLRLRRPVNEFVELSVTPRSVTATGSGLLHVTTPPRYRPWASYELTWSHRERPARARADERGRLRFTIFLGNAPPADHHEAAASLPGYHATATVTIRAVGGWP